MNTTKDIALDDLLSKCFREYNKIELGCALLKFTTGLVYYQVESKRIHSYYILDIPLDDFTPPVKLLDEDARVRMNTNDDGLVTKIYLYCRIITIKKNVMDRFWVKQMISMFEDELKKFSKFNLKSICADDYENNEFMTYYIYQEVSVNFINE